MSRSFLNSGTLIVIFTVFFSRSLADFPSLCGGIVLSFCPLPPLSPGGKRAMVEIELAPASNGILEINIRGLDGGGGGGGRRGKGKGRGRGGGDVMHRRYIRQFET
jgi:hypothetical protein